MTEFATDPRYEEACRWLVRKLRQNAEDPAFAMMSAPHGFRVLANALEAVSCKTWPEQPASPQPSRPFTKN